MKNILITILLTIVTCAIFVLFLLPNTLFAPRGTSGAYNVTSGFIWCSSTGSCLHETAHAMDYRMGRISQSREFVDTVNHYLSIDTMYSTKIRWFLSWIKKPSPIFSYNPYAELYAEMYMWSSGYKDNMPLDFQKFYQWDDTNTTWQVTP